MQYPGLILPKGTQPPSHLHGEAEDQHHSTLHRPVVCELGTFTNKDAEPVNCSLFVWSLGKSLNVFGTLGKDDKDGNNNQY
jgi:hypothetical protein